MWYVLQTMTGREEELVHYIEEIVPKELYTDCFVAYYERVWRKQQEYADSIVTAQYKKRYVIIRLKMMGSYKTVALGVILKEDIQQEIRYGKVETPLEMPEFYHAAQPEKDHGYAAGDHVSVISGSFENMSGVIWKVKKDTVEIGVHLFGQDMSMEVPVNDIRKNFP